MISTTYRINGINMHVVIAGTGPDVLLLHGFPDTHAIWREQIPALVAAGYRVIAPDLRGFGATDMSPKVRDYQLANLTNDVIALLDALEIDQARLIAHDWGAVIGWDLVIKYPKRFNRYIALSVGHPTCYATGGVMQKLKGYYIALFQLRGFAEWLFSCNNWTLFNAFTRCPQEMPHWRAALSRPGRLTAGMNYYRANLSLILPGRRGDVHVPVLGIYTSRDIALVENQMVRSAQYCKAGWQYQRIEGVGHWMTSEAPQILNPILINYLNQPLT